MSVALADPGDAAVIHWLAADNPHVLTTDFTVGAGDELVVHPGVQVRLGPGVTLWIDGGVLTCVGTEASPILFTRNQAGTSWGVVAFLNSTGNHVAYTTMEYADREPSLHNVHGGCLYLALRSAVAVDHSEFRNTGAEGIFAEGVSQVVVSDCHVHHTTRQGINVIHGASGGVYRCTLHDIGYLADEPKDGIEYSGSSIGTEVPVFEIAGCVIHDVADDGIDLDLGLDASIHENVIYDCGDKGISVSYGSNAVIFNNLIYDCYWQLAIQSGATGEIANCTLYGGTWGLRVLIDTGGWPPAHAVAKNVIAWGASASSVQVDGTSTLAATYCDFEEAWPGTGNFSMGPRFLNPGAGLFDLRNDSPCIDSGTSEAPAPPTDLEGNPRLDDPDVPDSGGGAVTYYDRGAYEWQTDLIGVEDVGGVSVSPAPHVFPSPSGATVVVEVAVTRAGAVRVDVIDARGRVVTTLLDRTLPTGRHAIRWDGAAHGRRVAPGTYFVRTLVPGSLPRAAKVVLW